MLHGIAWVPACPCQRAGEGDNKDEDSSAGHQHQLEWCKLYVLANKVGATSLASDVVTLFRRCTRKIRRGHGQDGHGLYPEAIDYIFKNTIESSPLRATLVNNAVHYYMQKKYKDTQHYVEAINSNAEFCADVTTEVRMHMGKDQSECIIIRCLVHPELWNKDTGGETYVISDPGSDSDVVWW